MPTAIDTTATTTMAHTDPIAEYESKLLNSKFLFVVFYRGHWCPFCISYLRSLEKLRPSIEAAGGQVIAVTAEPSEFLQATRDASGYQGHAIVDTHNLLARELRHKSNIEIAISPKGGYEHDMAQPAVLVTNAEGKVFQSWAIVPSVMNLRGAKDRPDLSQMWDNVEAELNGRPKVHQSYSLQTFFGTMFTKIFG